MYKFFSLLLFFPLIGFSQNNVVTAIDSFMNGQANHFNFNGNILVAEKGTIIYQQAFGYADYSTKRRLSNQSVFELASVSKQFTAAGILLLKQKGQLQLSDSLRKFFPELPYTNITIQQLLNHTSGLPDYMNAMQAGWDVQKVAFNNDVIAVMAKKKLPVHFQPGEKWEYSNTGYMLLASIIEKVSGMSFNEFMATNIFQPLGMNRTQIYNTRRSKKDTIADYAYGHVYSDFLKRYIVPDSIQQLKMVYFLDGITGDGTVNSTTGDLLIWDRALKNNQLLSKSIQKEMFAAQAPVDTANKLYYGYGVMTGKNEQGQYITHSGGWPGYSTILTRYLKRDITIIVLSNNNASSGALAASVTNLLYKKPVVMPYEHKAIVMDTAALDKFEGKYDGFYIERKGNKLYRNTTNQLEIIPESATKFFYSDGTDRQIEFELDKKGNAIKCWFIAYGFKIERKKL